MVPLALVNLVNMLKSGCRLELQGLIEVDDAPGSVLCSQVINRRREGWPTAQSTTNDYVWPEANM